MARSNGNGNGKAVVAVAKREPLFGCPQLDVNERFPMWYIVDGVYPTMKRRKKCGTCTLCGDFIGNAAVVHKLVATENFQPFVMPNNCRATHERNIQRVSSGIAR